MASGAGIIVDVREGYERREARIPGSVHVPLGELLDRLNELPSGKTRILQCHSGARSRMAADALAEMGNGDGFANLAGGIVAWARAGQPIEA